VLVSFSGGAPEALNAAVHALDRHLQDNGFYGFVEAVPGMASLLVYYDPRLIGFGDVVRRLQERQRRAGVTASRPRRVWVVPVWYGGEAGPDLAYVAGQTRLDEERVVTLHAARTYVVYFIGFMAGFPYMGPLDPALDVPRRAVPRVHVPAGSVAIAAGQTGIYPLAGPGGWHVIGRTPVPVWDAARTPPALFAPGDAVRFRPITSEEFCRLAATPDGGVLADAGGGCPDGGDDPAEAGDQPVGAGG